MTKENKLFAGTKIFCDINPKYEILKSQGTHKLVCDNEVLTNLMDFSASWFIVSCFQNFKN